MTIAIVATSFLFITGCQNRAHRDAYHAKMASEIRVLEDQLYDADYQNRVLRDKLERAGAHGYSSSSRSSSPRLAGPRDPDCCAPQPPPLTESHSYELPRDDDPNVVINEGLSAPETSDSPVEILPPEVNSSQTPLSDPPVPTPDPDTSPESESNPFENDPVDENAPGTPGDASPAPAETGGAGTTEELPAPPSNPEPPGSETLGFPPEIPGELIPPGPAEPDPPGRIRIPDEAKILQQAPIAPSLPPDTLPVPDRLEVHPQLSGGHQLDEDDEVDGMFLVINVLDESDDVVDLTKFDVDASMSVVAIDPELDESDQRIARWDFDPDEVREMIRRKPVDGLHISVKWQDSIPSSENVIVHVRLKAAEQEMRCQAKLSLKKSVAMSNWLPRARALR